MQSRRSAVLRGRKSHSSVAKFDNPDNTRHTKSVFCVVLLTHSYDHARLCRFDDKKRSLDSAVNSAQGNVNGIQNRINHLKWWERVEQPALEAALYTAKGVLAAAKWVSHM